MTSCAHLVVLLGLLSIVDSSLVAPKAVIVIGIFNLGRHERVLIYYEESASDRVSATVSRYLLRVMFDGSLSSSKTGFKIPKGAMMW